MKRYSGLLELRELVVLVRELEEVAAADVVLLHALDGRDVHGPLPVRGREHARVHPAEVLGELPLVRHADGGELRGDRRVLERGLADGLGGVLPVVDVHAVLAHADVLAELVAAEELSVEDHVHPRALLPHGHAQLVRHVVGDLVAEHALVVVVREQHPVLVLVAVRVESEHVGLGVELELVGFLGKALRGVAAHLDRERAAVDFLGGELRFAEDRAHRRVVLLLLRGGHQAVVRLDVEDGEPAHVVAADADEAVLVIRLHEQPVAVVRGCDGVAGGCREDVVGAAEGAVHAPPHVAERADRGAVVRRDAERERAAGRHAVADRRVERHSGARGDRRGLLAAERAHAARAAEDDVVDVVLHVVVGAVRLVAPARGVGVEPRGAVGRREDVSVHGVAHLVGADRQVELDADVEVGVLRRRDVGRREFRPVARRPADEREVCGVLRLGHAQDESGVGVGRRGGVLLSAAAGDERHARIDADGLVAV